MNKDDFPILKDITYLDNSATTQKPRQVIAAIADFYEASNSNVHRGVNRLAEKATMLYEKAREAAARFINAETAEIIFTKGTTESINFLAARLPIEKGDEIVLSEMEHHSNIVPWQQVAKEKGAVVKYIPVKENFILDMDKARELITEKTKVVSIVHMSNVLGTINPVKDICRMAHAVGAVFIVDAAQSVPHLKTDIKDLDCDYLVFSGHKMCGPTGIGVLYGKKELLEKLEPYQYGGGMIDEVSYERSTWTEVPSKFEAGTPNIAGAAGLLAAIEYLEEIGMDTIQEYEHGLMTYALQKLETIKGLKIIGPQDNRGAVISFTLEGIHPHDVSEILDRENIMVRGGHHCAMPLMKKLGVSGTTRASFYFYNTKDDVDALVSGISKVQEVFA